MMKSNSTTKKFNIFMIIFTIILGALVFAYAPEEKIYIYFGVVIGWGIIGQLAVLFLMKNRSSGPMNNEVSNKEQENNDDYHNDFSKVPSAPSDSPPPKPIDFTGNVFEHTEESFKDDMSKMDINPDKKK